MIAPAYRHDDRPVERSAFYAIACDPRRSVAVEACAGAGKTWMLVSRIVRALLAGARPHEILAITFTKKAAGEMRKRLHDWLAEWSHAPVHRLREELAARGLPDADEATCERLRGLYPALLAAGRPVQVRTFHSWFAALLQAAPIAVLEQLGLPARYELLQDDAEAVRRVWRPFHLAVARDPQARAAYEASVAAYGRWQTQKALANALAKRIEFAMADSHGALEEAVSTMQAQFPPFASVADAEAALGLPQVQQALLAAARTMARAGTAAFAERAAALEAAVGARRLDDVLLLLLTKEFEPRRFSARVASAPEVQAAQDLALQLCAARAQHAAREHHARMVVLTRVLLREFSALKRAHGWIDMNDVERAALSMLRDPVISGWVQERLDQQVRHLLVDEFQDTNPLQWQALGQWLQSYAGAGGQAPVVFIVGDPKQSIYRFRRAEPRVFDAAQHFIADVLQGDRLSCDHTRRNAAQVLRAVNDVMGAASQAGEFAGFRPHTTESSAQGGVFALPQVPRLPRARAQAAAPMWRDSLTQPRELEEERLVTLECRQAAAWIASEIARGTPASDILVLARRRDRLGEMEDELRALHVPAQQPEKTVLAECPEVQDVVALLDVLVSTSHDLSLARALRSPVFGASDADLAQVAALVRAAQAQGPAPSWFEALADAADLPPVLARARDSLGRWKRLVHALPPHDALQAIYADADLLARYAASAPAPLRESMLANLRAVPGAALEVQGGRYLTAYALVRALKSTRIAGPAVAAQGVVRLLTVHGAKGLEAPIVLLLDADGGPPPVETMSVLCDWPAEAAAPRRLAFLPSESRPPACSTEAMQQEMQARSREELNTLYVAMTRAVDRLVVSSVEPFRRGQAPTWWQRMAQAVQPLDAPAAPAADVSGERAPVLLRVLPQVAPAPAAGRQAATGTPATRFGEAVHRLLELGGAGGPLGRRIAREFALDAGTLARAEDMAARIRRGEAAWAWDPDTIDWQRNEVELHHRGELLRIDRLVRRADTREWWVLDYKSTSLPEEDVQLQAQMRRYREAVAAAHPDARVRIAFISGTGRLVEVE